MSRTPSLGGDDLEPLVTVSIVSHGDSKKVECLLESLRAYEQAGSKQIIITDNLGNELPELDPSPWSSLHILRNEHPHGFSHNHNRAFQLANGKLFLCLKSGRCF